MNNHKRFVKALEKLGACSPAIKWIKDNKLTPTQAWKQCVRPDWMLWLAGEIANGATDKEIRDYYTRAIYAAVSNCIDFLCDKYDITDDNIIQTSIQLDRMGQGEGPCYLPPAPYIDANWPWLCSAIESAVRAAYWSIYDSMHFGDNVGNLVWLFGPPVNIEIRKSLCHAIRQMIEKPTMEEIFSCYP